MKSPIGKRKSLTICLLSALAGLPSIGMAAESPANHSQFKRLALMQQQADVKQVIVDMVNAIDTKQWQKAQTSFADTVFVDYSSMSGQAGSKVAATDLISGWRNLLAEVETHHMLSNFQVSVKGKSAQVFSHVYASHSAQGIESWDIYGRYVHALENVNGRWQIVEITLQTHGQKGNLNFLQEASQMSQTKQVQSDNTRVIKSIEFLSDGEKIVGNLYLPKDYDASKQYPAVIVSGSWTTVKEQMAGLYADKLAEQGFIALAFDFRNFGQSEGAPRFYENPTQKVADIKSAVTYLQSLPTVNNDKIGALGICAGAMYTLIAASQDSRIQSVVTAASWLHDAEAVKQFYGGEAGVFEKITQAQQAKRQYQLTGDVAYIPSISTTDTSAAMYGPYDYYLNPERGAVPQWSDDKFAVMSWEDWLTIDPMPSAKELKTPTLMIHSDGAVLPDYTKRYFADIASEDKKLYWMETELASPYHQFIFYDQDAEVNESIAQASTWFNTHL
ncbi:alpha/beta fold hydrolase [Pseudoalteromonas luteoviolacea]|uniref:alpha/beta fold hydrolase n=1 Tax=Pseudoalteromonas luteoviolacea TaxID=43657 RepID=UPI001B37E871|nr:alpha/beta fold hydrolase [Pseudoalteromonas luteoviolacea]MBQ4810259.1 alpha/beta fold hydrolase [Pseudoalteromonas luteoviolacea]